jgi:hypothetical protein
MLETMFFASSSDRTPQRRHAALFVAREEKRKNR